SLFRFLAVGDHTLRCIARHRLISLEALHEISMSVRLRKQIRRVKMQLRLWHNCAHARVTAWNCISSKNVAAPPREIAEHVAEELVGCGDFDFIERLEQYGLALRCDCVE